MRIGLTPLVADPVTLRDDGVIMRGDEPFYDFETGEPVTSDSADPHAVLSVLRASGALSSRDKVFGLDIGSIPMYNSDRGQCGTPREKVPRNSSEEKCMARRSFIESEALAQLVQQAEPAPEPESVPTPPTPKQEVQPVVPQAEPKRRGRKPAQRAEQKAVGGDVQNIAFNDLLQAVEAFGKTLNPAELDHVEARVKILRAVLS